MTKSSDTSENSLILECREKLNKIEVTINGNNSHDGMRGRMIRIEENLELSSQVVKENAIHFNNFADKISNDIQNLLIAVTKLEASTATHQSSLHFNDLIKKKSFYAVVIPAIFIMIVIAMYIPRIWDGAMLAFGLPKLTIPIP